MKRSTPYFVAGLVFLVFAAPAMYVWTGLRTKSARVQEDRLHLLAEQSALRVEEYLQSRLLAVQVLQQGAESGLFLDRFPFQDQSLAIQNEFGGFQAVNWADSSYTIRWVVPLEGNEAAVDRNITENPIAKRALLEAVEERKNVMTPPIDLFQGGRGFASYYPVWAGEGEDQMLVGCVNGVFRIKPLIEGALNAGLRDNYHVYIDDEGEWVYRPSEEVSAAEPELDQEVIDQAHHAATEIQAQNRTWYLTLIPKKSFARMHQSDRHLSLLAGGLSFSVALAVLAALFLMRREGHRKQLAISRAMDERLAQSQKMEAVGQLAGGIAHDFNNLLTAITGSGSLAMAEVQAEGNASKHLQRLMHACRRASEMTGRLLTFSHASRVEQVYCDMGAELEELRGLLVPLVREDIALHYEVAPALGHIRVSPAELGQILVNLVTNAVGAMPKGGKLWVRASRTQLNPERERGDWVKLVVRDTGEGMTREVQDRVFEPFFSTKEAGQGTGFGMATVYGIVRRAGGSVVLESEPGQGTEIQICLPREAIQEAVLQTPTPRSDTPSWQGKILVVEDEPEVREVIRAILVAEGHEVRTARHGAEALQLLKSGAEFDLVCTDAVMPELGGVDLAKEARALGFRGGFVVCSGYTTDLSAHDMHSLGIVFLSKPFTREELLAAVATEVGPVRSSR
jgi:signal transduction histidine kinase/CheY-like chemotaxis protein